MNHSPELQFEIDYANEEAGWIRCHLVWRGVRRRLSASNVLPPFRMLLDLARAVLTHRLPYEGYWDEEGQGAQFEAWPLAPDSPLCRLRVKHDDQDDPWIDAEVDRSAVARAIFMALQDFVEHARPGADQEWELSAADIAEFAEMLENPVASRLDAATAQWISFRFSQSSHFDLPVIWIRFDIWGNHPAFHWVVDDADPFWRLWLDFCRQIAVHRLPAELKTLDHNQIHSIRAAARRRGADEIVLTPLPYFLFRAEPVAHPGHFRLRLTQTSRRRSDYVLLDEVLDNRAFIGAFCAAWDKFLAEEYRVYTDESGETVDVRALPWSELRALI